MSSELRARAWVHVDGGALQRNVRRVREVVGPDVAIIPMVKADAYGLGVRDAVRFLAEEGPWGYGVATVAEGLELREIGVEEPVLVCSPVPPSEMAAAVEAGLTLSVSDLEAVEALDRTARERARRAPFHVEVDTGMGRAGFPWREAPEWAGAVRRISDGVGAADSDGAGAPGAEEAPGARWTGIYTHFHSADEGGESPQRQWEGLREILEETAEVPEGLLVHAANSAGLFRGRDLHAQGVRPGIYLYGGRPGQDLPAPEPVAHVRARVVRVQDVPPGATVGYGATYTASREERWATLGIGYGDGLPRILGNRGSALLRERRVPIIGRISMDVTVVDITDLEARIQGPPVGSGEVATLLGSDGNGRIELEEVAEEAGTINYEILTGLTPRLPRIWRSEGPDGR